MASSVSIRAPARLARNHPLLLSSLLSTSSAPSRPARRTLVLATTAAITTTTTTTTTTASYRTQRRYFSSGLDGNPVPHAKKPSAQTTQPSTTTTDEQLETPVVEEAAAAEATQPAADADSSSEPWFLQVEPPRHPALVAHQPPLPPTPADSPALVEPLIRFVAHDLGMDELSVLDLREVTPPPALGPKLLMLIGTARSERHLHVSADRLVRWLRASHGVAAHADGLLGRNELKTKLRRRARKARLLGDADWDRADDGVSTGWICVNLGTVGWAPAAPDHDVLHTDPDGRLSGFGQPIEGTTLVVQLMTEHKREDLALERLWNGVLKKSIREKEALAQAQAQAARPHPPPYFNPKKKKERRQSSF